MSSLGSLLASMPIALNKTFINSVTIDQDIYEFIFKATEKTEGQKSCFLL